MSKRKLVSAGLLSCLLALAGCGGQTPLPPEFTPPAGDPAPSNPNDPSAGPPRAPAPGDVFSLSTNRSFVLTGNPEQGSVRLSLTVPANVGVDTVNWRIGEVRTRSGRLLFDAGDGQEAPESLGEVVPAADNLSAQYTAPDLFVDGDGNLVTEPVQVIVAVTAPEPQGQPADNARLAPPGEFVAASFSIEVRPSGGPLTVTATVTPNNVTINGNNPLVDNRTAVLEAVITGGSLVEGSLYEVVWSRGGERRTPAGQGESVGIRDSVDDPDTLPDTIFSQRLETSAQNPTGTNLYTVTVKDAIGNEASDTVVLTVNPELRVTPVLSPAQFDTGGELRPTLTANATGGTGVYTFRWSVDPAIDDLLDAEAVNGTSSPTTSFQAVKVGSLVPRFTVVVVDSAGNTATNFIERGANTAGAPGSAAQGLFVNIANAPGCVLAGDLVNNLQANASGGVAPLTFAWNSTCGGAFSSPASSTTNFTAPGSSAPGCQLTVTVTDANGTSRQATSNVNVSLPRVSFVAGTSTTAGEGGNHTVTARLTLEAGCAALSGAITATLIDTGPGTADSGIDYTAVPGSAGSTITFPSGSTEGTTRDFVVKLIDDDRNEANETIRLGMAISVGTAVVGVPDSHTVTITDDDVPGVLLTQSGGNTAVTEGGGNDSYNIRLTSEPAGDVTVTVDPDTQLDLSAGVGDPVVLTFTPSGGATPWNVNQTVTVAADDDGVAEGTHSGVITHTLASGDADYNGLLVSDVTVSITDNDSVQLAISDGFILEGDAGTAPMDFTVQMSGPSALPVSVNFATANGTATAGSDYVSRVGTVTFNPGDPLMQTVSIDILGDLISEGVETFTVTLTNPSNATLLVPTGTGNIIDNEGAPVVEFDVASVTPAFPEGDFGTSIVQLTVRLNVASAANVTVDFATTNITAISGLDYNAAADTLTFLPGQTARNISLTLLGDAIDEVDEVFAVTLSNPVGANLGANQVSIVTITDNDPPPTVTLGVILSPFAENGGVAGVTATLSAVSSMPVTVGLLFSGTAQLPLDYSPGAAQIVITPGTLVGQIPLIAADDTLDEPDETVIVDISTVTNGTENGVQQVTAIITDDDPPPLVSLSVAGSPIMEAGATSATVTATLSAISAQNVFITLLFGGSATFGSDYGVTGTEILIPAGSLTGSIDVGAGDDGDAEGVENVTVSIDAVINGTENGVQQVTIDIISDE